MSSSRVPLLCAFGVGCLSTAVLFGFWQADKRADASSATRARGAAAVMVAVAPHNDLPLSDDSARALTAAEPARVAERTDGPTEAPPVAKDAPDVANAPSPGGSAVSDVLMDLEAAYRQRLIAAARAEAEAARAPELPTTPPPSAAPAEPPREVAAQAIAPVAAPAAPAPVAVATPPAEPPPAEPPPVAAPAPVAIAQNDVRPSEVHIGDVNQNTYITNVRQGDVYVIQQQLAMLNYMQLAGMGANPGVVTPHIGRGSVPHQPEKQPYRQFPTTLTNPDNPWGFSFSPPNLVH